MAVWGVVLDLLAGCCCLKILPLVDPLVETYIKLLQMTVLPYITVSLILGFGSLTASQARQLASKGGALLLLFWAIALGAWYSYPFRSLAGNRLRFSVRLLQQPEQKDLLDLFDPVQPVSFTRREHGTRNRTVQHPAGCRAHGRDGEIGTPAHPLSIGCEVVSGE